MARKDIDDALVHIQREEWLRKIEDMKRNERPLEIIVSTHEGTDTTIYTEEDGSDTHLEIAHHE
jgi:hypothetical protein